MTRLPLLLRGAALLLVALALFWDFIPGRGTGGTRYAMVLDDSASMRSRFPGASKDATAAWAGFDGGSHPAILARQHPGPVGSPPAADEQLTDVGAALRAAVALFPAADPKRILLVTDAFWSADTLSGVGDELRKAHAAVYARRPPGGVRQAGAVVGCSYSVKVPLELPEARARVPAAEGR